MNVAARADGIAAGPANMIRARNLLTYAAIVSGSAAAFCAALLHDAALAGALMALAILADTFDGWFARRFPHSPLDASFGVELDSLADAINSGFVPVIVLGTLTVHGPPAAAFAWWMVGCLFTLSVVTRLGYYNITHEQGPWFVGMPAPVSALIVATGLIWTSGMLAAAVMLAGCAVAMLAPMRIPRPRGPGLAAFAAWALVVATVHAVVWLRTL